MADIFNNFSVVIENATITKDGLKPEEGKTGIVKFIPKNSEYYLISDNIFRAPIDGVFAVATEDEFVKSMGIGTIENDALLKKMWINYHDGKFYFTENREGEYVTMNLPFNPPKQKLNMCAIISRNSFNEGVFKGTAYEINVNKLKSAAFILYPFVNSLPLFFVEFETTLLSAYIGDDFNLLERALFNPDHFIKDKDAWV